MSRLHGTRYGYLRLIIGIVILLVPSWYLSPHLIGDGARLFGALGFPRTALFLASSLPEKYVSQSQLQFYASLAHLNDQPLANESRTVYLWTPPKTLSFEDEVEVFRLLDQARVQVGSAIGSVPSRLLVRAPRVLQEDELGRFSGRFIDIRFDKLRSSDIVYHEVTHAALWRHLLWGGAVVDLPPWFEEGLSEYIPISLGISSGFSDIRLSPQARIPRYEELDYWTRSRGDYFPASTAVAKLAELSGGMAGLRRIIERLRYGDHFVQALPRVTGLTNDEFGRRWERWFRYTFVEETDEPALLLARARELVELGRPASAWVYIARLGEVARESDDAHELRARILAAQAKNMIERGSIDEAFRRTDLALVALGSIQRRSEEIERFESSLRDWYAEQKMRSAGRQERHQIGDPPLERFSGVTLRLALVPALVLLILFAAWFIKHVCFPFVIILWSSVGTPGSLVIPCILLFALTWALKCLTGMGLSWFDILVTEASTVGRTGAHVIYLWLSSLMLWLLGHRIFVSSGGLDPGGAGPFFSAYCTYGVVLLIAFGGLWWCGLVVLSVHGVSWFTVGHAVILSVVVSFGQETFFRGGIFKSAELSFHTGSAAALSSLLWAVWWVGPQVSFGRFASVFLVGMMFCSLVAKTGRVGVAAGAGAATLAIDWLFFGNLALFGDGFLSDSQGCSSWWNADGLGFISLPMWVPILMIAWLITLRMVRSWHIPHGRTSRIFYSFPGS